MKRINPLEYYQPNTFIEVEMQKPKEGNFPIGRADTGIICLLPRGTKGFFEYNSRWKVQVLEVKENRLLIKPIKEILSAQQNEARLLEMVQTLVREKPQHRKKEKPQYQFASKNG
jgi:hypothetical protein